MAIMKKTVTIILLLACFTIPPVYSDTAVLVKTIVGPDTLTIFGASIAPVKNFRGTNEIDLLIGAYDRSGSIGSPGWAYMYYGGGSFDSLWDVQYRGEQGGAGDWTAYGKAVSSAGDFCADGYTDIVVGSPGYDAPNSNGRVYVYKGGAIPDTVPLWALTGAAFAGLGSAVHCLGDLDHDECSDIIAGAPGEYKAGGYDGAAYIYLGDSTVVVADSIIDYVLFGAGDRNNENFGSSLTSGDFNDDGWVDVIVGAPGSPTDTSICGRVYVFYGGTGFDANHDLFFDGRQKTAFFGQSISHGDFNNDGYEDVIVGEYGYNSNTGRAYIYLGGASPDTVPDLILNGEQTGSCFGYQVCGAGDLNGDSIDDWLVAAPWYTTPTDSFAGKVNVYFGKVALDTILSATITGNYYKSRIGTNVTSLADINNDGNNEFSVKWGSPVNGIPSNIKIYKIGANGITGYPEEKNKIKYIKANCYPNPFFSKTVINFQVPKDSDIRLGIYNIVGQLVKTLDRGFKKADDYKVEWDGTGDDGKRLNNGIYFYKLNINNQTIINKLILIK